MVGQRPSQGSSDVGDVPSTWWQWPTVASTWHQAVSGESHHREAIERVARIDATGAPTRRHFVARLVADPSNPHDGNAIRVIADGETLGHIPRRETDRFHEMISAFASQGLPYTCRAWITGGRTDAPSLGVVLHVGSALDRGLGFIQGPRVVTVIAEDRHRSAIEPHVGRTVVPVHLRADPSTGNVGVSIEGAEVGRLTSTETGDAALVDLANRSEFGATAFARVDRRPEGLVLAVHLLAEPAALMEAMEAPPTGANADDGDAAAGGRTPAGWFADPHGRHELRYWDGSRWTEHVSDAGVVGEETVF